MKIYTRKGDTGHSTDFTGKKILKSDLLFDAVGTIDELNSFLGLAIAFLDPGELAAGLQQQQNLLFVLGSEIAGYDKTGITLEHSTGLETAIDAMERELEPLKVFILPGGCQAAASLHVARSVCRRAERLLVALAGNEPAKFKFSLMYLNRLSDYLFVAARLANMQAGISDIQWQK